MPRHQKRSSAAGGSQRQLRVGEIVRHAMADILAQGSTHDAELEGHIITVPEVKMSPDLKLATISVMPLGGEGAASILDALNRHKKELRALLARRINLKFAPDLRFALDGSFDAQARIDALLRSPEVARDLRRDSDDSESQR